MSTTLTCSGCHEKVPDYIFLFSKPWCGFSCARRNDTAKLRPPRATKIRPAFAGAIALPR